MTTPEQDAQHDAASQYTPEQLQEIGEDGNKVKAMMEHAGWKEIVGPMFQRSKADHLTRMLACGPAQVTEMLGHKYAINAIADMQNQLDFLIEQGRQAREQMSK